MRRNVASRMGAVLLSCAATSRARGDEPPTLPPPIEAPSSPETGPVLVVPGVPTSAFPRSRPGASAPEPRPPAALDDVPALIGPSEMPDSGLVGSPRPDAPASTSRGALPLELDEVPDPLVPTPPRTRPTPRSDEAPPPVRRGPRIFRRFAPPSAFTGRGSRATRGEDPEEPEAKAKSDPAADAELKRRIERQVREAVGDRVRSVEVRVVGRNVAIRAEACALLAAPERQAHARIAPRPGRLSDQHRCRRLRWVSLSGSTSRPRSPRRCASGRVPGAPRGDSGGRASGPRPATR